MSFTAASLTISMFKQNTPEKFRQEQKKVKEDAIDIEKLSESEEAQKKRDCEGIRQYFI